MLVAVLWVPVQPVQLLQAESEAIEAFPRDSQDPKKTPNVASKNMANSRFNRFN